MTVEVKGRKGAGEDRDEGGKEKNDGKENKKKEEDE
jgi:hypothetical protein